MGQFRRGAADTLRVINRNPTSDPAAVAKHVLVYSKDVSGVSQLFARASDGTVSQLTPGATIPPVADTGNRSQTRRGGADVLRIIEVAADPTPVLGEVLFYGKAVAGVTQLFTCDGAGNVLQITPHLTVTPSGGAAGSEVRRDGSEVLKTIGRSDDATAIASSTLLYSKLVNNFAQLFARLSDGTVALISTGPLDTTGAKPGQIYVSGGVAGGGAAGWSPNMPACWDGAYWEYENGGNGLTGQGMNAWQNAFVGAGAQRLPLTGEFGWFPNAASFETGSTSTGSASALRQVGLQASSISGLLSYDATVSLPVLSDGSNTYMFVCGLQNTVNGNLSSAGAFVRYTHSNNGGRFEFVTANNNIKTISDTGIAVVAGNYYHIRCTVTNDGTASCYIKTTYSGGVWHDDGVWGAPTVTHVTNIPSGASNMFIGLSAIVKSVGTTSRLYKLGFQLMYRIPTFTPTGNIIAGTGLQLGDGATAIAVDPSTNPAWITPLRIESPIIFRAYGRGGWIPTSSPDFATVGGGTGGTGSISSPGSVANEWFGTSNLNTSNTASDGFAFYQTSYTLNLDSTVNEMIIECVLDIPTLSTGAQTFKATLGLFNQTSSALTNGVTIEIDSNANVHAQCVCTSGGVATTVDSGVTITAALTYLWRIVITPGNVDFYVARDGVTTLTTPVASISTNIPTGVTMAAGLGLRKTVGTTNRNLQFGYVLAYQRSSQ